MALWANTTLATAARSAARSVSARTPRTWYGARAARRNRWKASRAYTARLFVAAANTNNVYAVAVTEGKELSVIESINISMTPRQPLGMTPSGLALSADNRRLFVACSDGNVAAVVDISAERSRVEGFIPTGWYPTAVRALPSGTLIVLNGKGLRSYPNPNGPSPRRRVEPVHKGTPGGGICRHGCKPERHRGSTPSAPVSFRSGRGKPSRTARIAIPSWTSQDTLPPIQHVIYIVKENRTYDQVLGDMKEGNGDSNLTLFGENVTPNLA